MKTNILNILFLIIFILSLNCECSIKRNKSPETIFLEESILFFWVSSHQILSSSEIYDPATKKFTYLDYTLGYRYQHTATTLANGKVLICGGAASFGLTADCKVFDSTNSSVKSLGTMNFARNSHSAILLQDGKVLISGGVCSSEKEPSKTAEIFDPLTEKFTLVGNLNFPRCVHESILLSNGKVLIVGGKNFLNLENKVTVSENEIFDPQTLQFSIIAKLNTPRINFSSVTLIDNSIMIFGGYSEESKQALLSTEIYNNNSFSFGPNMNSARNVVGLSKLCNNEILITGGVNQDQVLNSAEIFSSSLNSISRLSNSMIIPRYGHSSILLDDCNVLIIGGDYSRLIDRIIYSETEIYNSSEKKFIESGKLNEYRRYFSATKLPNGKVLIVGGINF
jgi:N-acetylneuraminic acid mutarotase